MHQVKGVVARARVSRSSSSPSTCPTRVRARRWCKVQACGVCHTDLHYREGGINDDFPFLLGHEAAGIVEAVGPDVTTVAPGDFVILNWRAVCGDCRACNRGEPQYCFATHNATQKMTLEDGTELSPALGIGAFAEKTLVAAGQCTKVDPSARPGRRRPARLRRDGRHRRRDQHRRGDPRQVRRGHRLRRRRRRRDRRLRARRREPDHRRRHRREEARAGARRWARPTRSTPRQVDPVAAIQELDRRQRRRRRDRGGRPPGDLEAGVLRPRPGRHRRPGRRAHAGHDGSRTSRSSTCSVAAAR